VAGLVAAIELQAAGRAVLVLDAAPAVGGRVRSTVQDGLVIDHGFQVLFTAYPTLRRYLDFDRLALRKFLPAARIAPIYAGSSEVMKMIISRDCLGKDYESFNTRNF
jgi:phytoene dehydrogenase-like protein